VPRVAPAAAPTAPAKAGFGLDWTMLGLLFAVRRGARKSRPREVR
jgi:hypothetical protein